MLFVVSHASPALQSLSPKHDPALSHVAPVGQNGCTVVSVSHIPFVGQTAFCMHAVSGGSSMLGHVYSPGVQLLVSDFCDT